MEKEFIPYEQALALKELGFDFDVFRSYDTSVVNLDGQFLLDYYYNVRSVDEIKAPTYSQAFRWFREKYSLYSHVRESYAFDNTLEFVTQINGSYVNHGIADKPINRFETYEEAELECLKKLIEIVKEK